MRVSGSEELRCSFCSKSQSAVTKLISSPSDYPRAYICNECIAVCNSILGDDLNREKEAAMPEPEPPELSPVVVKLAQFAEFSPAKMAKATIFPGKTLFAGLNCFEPGQEHAAHAHAGQDKLYVVLEGEAEIQVGGEKKLVPAGGGAFAPSGVMHSVRNISGSRLVVLAVLAPPPAK